MAQVTFTKEHLAKLKELATKALFSNIVVKGKIGTNLTIQDLLHNTTINTVVDLNAQLKKEIDKTTNLDEWSMTDYQQKKLESLKESQELVNLIIGYRKYQSQKESAKSELAELKAQYVELKQSQMTPEERLKELENKMSSIGNIAEEEII